MTTCPTLVDQVRARRLAALPLEVRAGAVWTAAHQARHAPNWGTALSVGHRMLDAARRDPHPLIRRIAEGCALPGAETGPIPDPEGTSVRAAP